MINIVPVSNKKQKKAFIHFPWQVYQDDQYWVPPLLMDVKSKLSAKHPYFEFIDMELFLAYRGNEICGRIAAIKNNRHNEYHKDKVGFFGFFECLDDQAVANGLFAKAEAWLKQKGCDRVHGPASPSSNYEYGFLTNAFDDESRILMTYNPSYYIDLAINYGFKEVKGLLAYKMDAKTVMANEKLQRGVRIVKERSGIKLRQVNMKRFKDEVRVLKDIYNKAWAPNYMHVPFTEAEIDLMAKELKPVVSPELCIFGEIDGKTVGLGLALLDYHYILKQMNGRLFPFNFLKFFTQKKHIKWCRVVILGIIPEFQKKGLDVTFYMELIKAGLAMGLEYGEASWILEDNDMMNRGMKMVNAEPYKRYAVYEKTIT